MTDVSPQRDGSALRLTLAAGEAIEFARRLFECTFDLSLRPSVDAPEGELFSDHKLSATAGCAANEPWVASLGERLGGVDVGCVLDACLPDMKRGQECEVRCSASLVGGTYPRLCATVKMRDWVRVEPVFHTEEQLLKRTLHEPPGQGVPRPNDGAKVHARWTVRRPPADAPPLRCAGEVLERSHEDGVEWIQGEGCTPGVLPMLDACVKDMKLGERAVVRGDAHWAYCSPDYAPADGGSRVECSEAVEVEVELLGFVKGKEPMEMDGDEKLAAQRALKERGNVLFLRGEFHAAARKYEAAIRASPAEV